MPRYPSQIAYGKAAPPLPYGGPSTRQPEKVSHCAAPLSHLSNPSHSTCFHQSVQRGIHNFMPRYPSQIAYGKAAPPLPYDITDTLIIQLASIRVSVMSYGSGGAAFPYAI
jgi:hypothetical protein